MTALTAMQQTVHDAVESVEQAAALDGPAKAAGKAVRGALPPGEAREALSGTWLGHALHPLLTDVVIGTWTSGLLLDLLGGERDAAAARRLVGAGILAAVPTAVTGTTDWADAEPADDRVRRAGVVHAVSNTVALALQVASLAARRRGDRRRGIALSLGASAALGVGGHLGAHLTYVRGVGVDQTAFDEGPQEWTPVLDAADLRDEPQRVVVDDTPVLVVRDGGEVRAIHDRCSHRGCSLAEGRIEDGVVECACHGSQYALADGRLVRGPAVVGQPAFDVRVTGGRIEICLQRD